MLSSFPSRIFQIAPEAIELFPKFSNVPPQELEQNLDFKDHSLKVVETIELATSMLQEIDDLSNILISLGSMHVSMGLQDAHFDVSERNYFYAYHNKNVIPLLLSNLMYGDSSPFPLKSLCFLFLFRWWAKRCCGPLAKAWAMPSPSWYETLGVPSLRLLAAA